ncbi:MAG: flagellar biosynthetic protein FliO [Myxococcales bacterium]|nr:MAG: flagellar biosynthetic protein FliO [Myxococcales bacterium]
MLLQSLLALAAICLLAWLVLRWISSSFQQRSSGAKHLRVIDSIALGPRSRIYIVQSAQRAWLMGSGVEGQVQMLCELDPADIPQQEQAPSSHFAHALIQAKAKLSPKKDGQS